MYNAGKVIEEIRHINSIKVKVKHRRPIMGAEHILCTKWQLKEQSEFIDDNPEYLKWQFDTFSLYGGETTVTIIVGEDRKFIGMAKCSPRDKFNKKLGLQIAFGRAWKLWNGKI
jgi:hypothetical protein